SPDDTERLGRLTAGWAAGIVLALEGATLDRRLAAAAEEASVPQQIFDYFASEVLALEPAEMQRFLLESSILPFMTETLLARLVDDDAGKLLGRFRLGNFFVTEYGPSANAWRYHPLFHEFLSRRAEQDLSSADRSALMSKAAALLDSVGESEAAF